MGNFFVSSVLESQSSDRSDKLKIRIKGCPWKPEPVIKRMRVTTLLAFDPSTLRLGNKGNTVVSETLKWATTSMTSLPHQEDGDPVRCRQCSGMSMRLVMAVRIA